MEYMVHSFLFSPNDDIKSPSSLEAGPPFFLQQRSRQHVPTCHSTHCSGPEIPPIQAPATRHSLGNASSIWESLELEKALLPAIHADKDLSLLQDWRGVLSLAANPMSEKSRTEKEHEVYGGKQGKLRQWFSTLPASWNQLGSFKEILRLGSLSSLSFHIEIMTEFWDCDLGIRTFINSACESNFQARLGNHCFKGRKLPHA